MKKGGALPSNKGASKAGMQSKQGRNFLLPKEEKPKRGRDPERKPKFTPKPMPMPMPRPRPKDGPDFRPMPMPRPKRKLPKEIEKFLMDMPRMRPALKKDGGTMKSMADLFGKGVTGTLAKIPPSTLKKAFEKAKKLKPSRRLNVDDIKKAIDSMKKAKKIDMSPGRRKAMTGSTTGKTRAEKLAQSIKDRSVGQKLRRKQRKMI